MNEERPAYSIERLPEDSTLWDAVVRFVAKHDAEFVPPISRRMGVQMGVEAYVRGFRGGSGLVLAAVSDGELVGCVGAFFRHPERDTPFIQYIAVARPFRRTGLADALILAALDVMYEAGARRVETRTWSTNHASQAMLERLGFIGSERLADDRAPGIDTLIFEKPLP